MSVVHRETVPEFDRRVPILIVNLGGYPFHHGVLGVIRSLGRLGVPVYMVQRKIHSPTAASRYLTARFRCEGIGTDRDRFLECMSAIGKALFTPVILVPCDDLSAIMIAENAGALAPTFIFPHQSPGLPRTLSNKQSLYNLCPRFGVACPQTFYPKSREELLEIAARQQFPVIIKAAESWLLPKGFTSVAIAARRQDLITYYDNFARQSPATTLMVQEMIPDAESEDWFVHGYCDSNSKPLVLFSGVKLRSYPAFAGSTSLGRSVQNDALLQQATEFLSGIGYRGIMDLDWRYDRRDGRYKLLDFNPRIGAQFGIFSTDIGIDVVRAMHLDLTERHPHFGLGIEGRTFMLDVQDILASLKYWQNGRLTIRDWLCSVRSTQIRAWYADDDLLPFLQMAIMMSIQISRNSLRKAILGFQRAQHGPASTAEKT